MFECITKFLNKFKKSEKEESKSTAKERLHLVLAQDRANISADFLEMMKQEILEVIKKYIDIDEKAMDVRLTNKEGEDGLVGAPSLYANIPIKTIKNEARKMEGTIKKEEKTEEVPEKEESDSDIETNDQQEAKEDNITEEIELSDNEKLDEVSDEEKNS